MEGSIDTAAALASVALSKEAVAHKPTVAVMEDLCFNIDLRIRSCSLLPAGTLPHAEIRLITDTLVCSMMFQVCVGFILKIFRIAVSQVKDEKDDKLMTTYNMMTKSAQTLAMVGANVTDY